MVRTKKRISKVTIRQAERALSILFPSVRCTVAPNRSHEIWVKDAEGYGFVIVLSAGNAGISVTIRKFLGQPAVSVTGNLHPNAEAIPMVDAMEISATVYRQDQYAEQFKRWYQCDSSETWLNNDAFKHPSDIGLTPEYRGFDVLTDTKPVRTGFITQEAIQGVCKHCGSIGTVGTECAMCEPSDGLGPMIYQTVTSTEGN